MAQPENLRTVFDPKRNALNAVRLFLALSVLLYHSAHLIGSEIAFAPLQQLAGRLGVDGFFAISGFLIVSSWVRNPNWLQFLRARFLRIFPGFWVCLVITAGVFAPLAVIYQGSRFPSGFTVDAIYYVLKNALLRMVQYDIAGTPLGVQYAGVWNGSLWTLFWEFLCYLGVVVVGVTGLLRWRGTLPVLFVLSLVGVLVTSYGPVDNFFLVRGARFGVMFLAGALIFQFQDRIVVRWQLVVAAAVVVLTSALLPDYRVVAAIPLAYLVICIGAMVKHPRLRIKNDLSYGTYIYAFPLQQLLAVAGTAALGMPAFAVLSILTTLPIAALSWFFVERPCLRLKSKAQTPPPAGATAGISPPRVGQD